MLLVLASCALDGMFLAPYPLHADDSFTRYVEKYNDSLTLSFAEDKSPVIVDSKGAPKELPYTVESLFFESTSGNTLHAWYLLPKENYNGKVLYFLHGNAGNLVYQYALATPFAERGFKVFMMDYSGFGFSSGEATRKNVLKDADSGFEYLYTTLHHDTEEIIIYGQSLGGHLAGSIAAHPQHKDRFSALVIEGAFSSHKDIAAKHVPVLGRIFTREMYSAEKSLPLIHVPVLVIHSTEDKVIPYKQGVRLYERANSPKSLYTIDQAHVRGPIYYPDSICARILRMVP